MRRLICAIFLMCLAMPAFSAEAALPQDSIAVPAGLAAAPPRPDNDRLAVNSSADYSGGQYAQNLETSALPETAGDGGQQPARSEADGFQGGGTFEHFDDQRRIGAGTGGDLPAGYEGAGHEPPDQSDLDQYNLMMKAWQKD